MRLRERRDRLYRSGAPEFDHELERFVAWLEGRPYIATILNEIETANVEYDDWVVTSSRSKPTFPPAELERTKICLEICRRGDPHNLTRALTSSYFEDLDRVFVEAFVDPVVNFIEDRLEEGASILSLLLRYKRRVEWFERARLFGLSRNDPERAELLLDSDLRRFLLDSGVDYPFSHRSELEELESQLGDDQPLALQTRVFAPKLGADAHQLRQGLAQAFALAVEHGRPAGYLTVFNLAPERLVFRTSAPRGQVPSIRTDDKRVFVVCIHTNPEVAFDAETGRITQYEVDESVLARREPSAAG
jgi:hypothetical protein